MKKTFIACLLSLAVPCVALAQDDICGILDIGEDLSLELRDGVFSDLEDGSEVMDAVPEVKKAQERIAGSLASVEILKGKNEGLKFSIKPQSKKGKLISVSKVGNYLGAIYKGDFLLIDLDGEGEVMSAAISASKKKISFKINDYFFTPEDCPDLGDGEDEEAPIEEEE